LGLLVEDIPGPDLDHLIMRACNAGEMDRLHGALENLAGLLARWHSRPLTKHTKHPENPGTPKSPAAPAEALDYFDKVAGQLKAKGFLSPEDEEFLTEARNSWEKRLPKFPDHRVLVHGDATPTNFLFPNGRVVALDLERLRLADRLWDLSWVAGELKHAWGWRRGDWQSSEGPIRRFFRAYLSALPGNGPLEERLHFLNPFYMALAELRIARNGYLAADYRRELLAEARRCLAGSRCS
jgi:Ser/Thr protein kinase RdoA (MazF antagonist)